MKYFTIKELCASSVARNKGISNVPSAEVIANLNTLVDKVLDPARERLGEPIKVNSGYRCKELNDAVGGASTSQHITGCAADLRCSDLNRLYDILADMEVDQLLFEKSKRTKWIHVSYREGKNRNYKNNNYQV